MATTFVLLGEPDLPSLARLDPDRDWREFVTGERAWILQTYLRLRTLGLEVQLAGALPSDGTAVFHTKQRRALLRQLPSATDALLVGTRGDLGEALIADLEVVQNPAQSDDSRRFHLPHWPQPGLLPRDTGRGTALENIAFKGFLGNLHSGFREPAWAQFLTAHGLRWLSDATDYRRDGAIDAAALDWNDFRTVDLVVAVRSPDARLHPRKPATKLYNAWHAGVPALLGPETAYRDLRRSSLDFIEVATPTEARAAIERLCAEPQLYAAMVANGRERARDFSVAAIAARWQQFLGDTAPALAQRPDVTRWRGRSLRAKELSRRALRALGLWR